MRKRILIGSLALAGIAIYSWAQVTTPNREREAAPAGSGSPEKTETIMAASVTKGPMMNGSGMNGSGMNGSGIMQGRIEGTISDPIWGATMTVFALPEMRSDLGLSDKQLTDLNKLKDGSLSKAKDLSGKVAAKERELRELLSAETSRTGTVRTLLNDIGELRAQRQFLAYETSTKMKAALAANQRAKLAAMKPADLHQLVMSRVSMPDRMLMMQFAGVESMMREFMMSGDAKAGGMPMTAPAGK